ncbi:MAG: SDR family oxidoreductase [Pseudomonadota bacterium]
MGRLDGKTAAVTGAGRGIGVEYAKKLAAEGANVVVTDILDTAGTIDAIKAAGGSAIGMKVDVTSDDDLAAMVAKAESEYGALNILVNNAGLFANLTPKPFLQIDNDEFDKVMTVNARSIHQATKAAVPAMLRAGGGKIVNIASGTFYYGPPGLSHYTASKAAVIGLTRGHARELGDKNIQINAMAVGLTESDSIKDHAGFDPARAPTVQSRSIKRDMLPEDLLGTLMFLVTPDSDFITGQTINIDGGKVNL